MKFKLLILSILQSEFSVLILSSHLIGNDWANRLIPSNYIGVLTGGNGVSLYWLRKKALEVALGNCRRLSSFLS